MRFDDGGELAMTDGRRLGRILLRDDPEREPPVAKLGFDPLLAMPPPKRFSELIRARGANVKSLLLDQSFAAGVGNWIADEVLYQAGIDPRRHAASLTDAEACRLRARLAADRQARGRRERRRCALPAHVAVPPPLGQARERDDDARRPHRAPDHRWTHDRMGADRATLTAALTAPRCGRSCAGCWGCSGRGRTPQITLVGELLAHIRLPGVAADAAGHRALTAA
ncbi:Formamidopyrimidine-DNA glycosylase [Geodia barretti]|uniref:Formamidopyrimidine-DNA glycosylase n=1 Tax=Geodia barretti TaxID=519541 RepID=A0AA35SS44_GEOBA|nr:Formamidopyrimidine-DNA glycosylase [Geodia barretti]